MKSNKYHIRLILFGILLIVALARLFYDHYEMKDRVGELGFFSIEQWEKLPQADKIAQGDKFEQYLLIRALLGDILIFRFLAIIAGIGLVWTFYRKRKTEKRYDPDDLIDQLGR